jgi:hypothetical protein
VAPYTADWTQYTFNFTPKSSGNARLSFVWSGAETAEPKYNQNGMLLDDVVVTAAKTSKTTTSTKVEGATTATATTLLRDNLILNGSFEDATYSTAGNSLEYLGPNQFPMVAVQASGLKVWFNGKLVISDNGAGRKSKGVPILAGWNTILVKVNQNDAAYKPLLEGQGNFWCRLGFLQAGQMGRALSVPGLPLEDKPAARDSATGVAMEVRLDSVEGKVIGTFHHGQTEVNADARVTGVHNVYLVFPQDAVKSVNWFRFE